MRRLRDYFSKVGLATPEFEIWPRTATPPFVGHIRPTAEPSITPAEGDFYWDATANMLKVYNGSAWVVLADTGGATAFEDVTITDDLAVGGDSALTGALAVTTADTLTVGGVIVPQFGYIAARVGPHATVTEYDLFVAPRALQVTRIDVVPSTLQGGALTATICKATGTNAPANGTTPMHTANAIDLNTGAYTVQNITLTVTTADLQLAAGDRIGIDYSAALTAGHAAVTISYKYI